MLEEDNDLPGVDQNQGGDNSEQLEDDLAPLPETDEVYEKSDESEVRKFIEGVVEQTPEVKKLVWGAEEDEYKSEEEIRSLLPDYGFGEDNKDKQERIAQGFIALKRFAGNPLIRDVFATHKHRQEWEKNTVQAANMEFGEEFSVKVHDTLHANKLSAGTQFALAQRLQQSIEMYNELGYGDHVLVLQMKQVVDLSHRIIKNDELETLIQKWEDTKQETRLVKQILQQSGFKNEGDK